jgi:hypothetical protein
LFFGGCQKDLLENDENYISVSVDCSNVFMWGTSDAEQLPFKEISNLFNMWIKDSIWGPVVWCCIQRNELPQKTICKKIKEAGIWDLSSLNLQENKYEKNNERKQR